MIRSITYSYTLVRRDKNMTPLRVVISNDYEKKQNVMSLVTCMSTFINRRSSDTK